MLTQEIEDVLAYVRRMSTNEEDYREIVAMLGLDDLSLAKLR